MTLTSDISSYGVPGGAVTTAENWEREYEARIAELESRIREMDDACDRIAPYLRWTVGDESPSYHPTMPSAVAAFLASAKRFRGGQEA